MFTPSIAPKTSRTPNLHAPTLIPKTLPNSPLAAPPALGDSETPFDDTEWPDVGLETQEILRGDPTARPEPDAPASIDDLPDMTEDTFETDFIERQYSDTPAPVDYRTGTEDDPAFGSFSDSDAPGWGSTSGDTSAEFGDWNDMGDDEFDDEVYAHKRGAPTLLIVVGIGLLFLMLGAAAVLFFWPNAPTEAIPEPAATPSPTEPLPAAPAPPKEEAAEANSPAPAPENAAEETPPRPPPPRNRLRRTTTRRSAPKDVPAAAPSRPTRIEPDNKAEKKSLLDRLRRGPNIQAKPMEEAEAAPEAEDVWGAAPSE